jgi:formylglycine-generating enzyme required for sulfatase activity
MFYALLIDTKDSKVSGRGSYIRTGVSSGDLPRVSLALSRQLDGPGRRARKDVTPTQKSFEPEMVFVEGGTFDMGCTAEQKNDCITDEQPVHPVTLSSFYIGKYLVTREQWTAIMSGAKGRTGSPTINDATATFTQDISNLGYWKDDDQLPIESVSWEDITGRHGITGADLTEVEGYLERLNKLTGKNYRLPTEAEWEYAARGGKHHSPYIYSGSNTPNDIAWYTSNSGGRTHVVGGKNPNALGIYDMSGNINEFCSDYYGENYYSTIANGATNPTGPTSGSQRVIRGGCFRDAVTGRVSSRAGIYLGPGRRDNVFGFRVVLPAQ